MTSERCVIYTRVSTDMQARDGVGLETQLSRCRAMAVTRGFEVVAEVSDEGVSGKRGVDHRPGLAQALAHAKAGCAVVVYSVSRLARSQRLLWEMLDPNGGLGLRLVSVTEPFDTTTPMGRAMLGMIAVWSQLEADLVSQRTKDALARVKANGVELGAPAMAEVLPKDVLDRVVALRDDRRLSLRRIADELNREGIKGARGGRWHPKTVTCALLQARGGLDAPGDGAQGLQEDIRAAKALVGAR